MKAGHHNNGVIGDSDGHRAGFRVPGIGYPTADGRMTKAVCGVSAKGSDVRARGVDLGRRPDTSGDATT
jgi:hypothetical protein